MATSGNSDFTSTRDDICTQALQNIGKLALGDTISTAQATDASKVLNAVVKNLQTKGVRLWTVERAVQRIQDSTEKTGSDGLVYTCIYSHTAATTNKPITGANWHAYWVLRGSTGGTWSANDACNSSGDYSLAADTLGIEKIIVRGPSGSDTPVYLRSRAAFTDLSSTRTFSPMPDTAMVELGRDTRKLFVYPLPSDNNYTLIYDRVRKSEDFDANNNDPDFPQKWILPLQRMLTAELADSYGLPLQERLYFRKLATTDIEDARISDWDEENPYSTSVKGAFPRG